MALPPMLVWLVTRPLFSPAWGSPLLILSFLTGYWILPFTLASGAYVLAKDLAGLERGLDFRPFLSFTLGFMSVFNLAYAICHWNVVHPAYTLVLPVLLVTSTLAYAVGFEETIRDGLPGGLKWLAGLLGIFMLDATALAMFFLRMEWLGWVLALSLATACGFFGFKRLQRRP
ncbi:MAG: hypothetical protein A3J97_03290 [Spirochaetes bacterium RIFOXYC1_FULL_54_7]|nr:MAG: hypothetical protein A3J97_03290 [Spirochaetes bacterium RIFOXYC1_FULL_54_7]